MVEDTALLEKRAELKRKLATGEYKTLVDVILDGTGRLIQKFTRNSNPPSFWYSAVVIGLLILLIGFSTSLSLDEFYSGRREFIPIEISHLAITLAALIAIRLITRILFSTLCNHIFDAIESITDLTDFQYWLSTFGNLKKPLFFSLTYSILITVYFLIFAVTDRGGFIGLGPIIFNLMGSFLAGMPIYYLFLLLTLPTRLSRYQFKLYAADPSSSEVIDHLADMFIYFLYVGTTSAVILSLAGVFFELVSFSNIILMTLLLWAPLTAFFVITQIALAKIITGAKWKTLNETQAKIERLQTQEDIPSQETLAHLGKLMDYHDRIKATRNSALDLRAGLNFLNSLLLPLLAFVLGNLDKILAYFS